MKNTMTHPAREGSASEFEDMRGQRCSTADDDTDVVSEEGSDFGEKEHVPHRVLGEDSPEKKKAEVNARHGIRLFPHKGYP